MEEGSFGDVVDVGFKSEGLIKNDAKVTDVGGSRNSGAVNTEGEVIVGRVE